MNIDLNSTFQFNGRISTNLENWNSNLHSKWCSMEVANLRKKLHVTDRDGN